MVRLVLHRLHAADRAVPVASLVHIRRPSRVRAIRLSFVIEIRRNSAVEHHFADEVAVRPPARCLLPELDDADAAAFELRPRCLLVLINTGENAAGGDTVDDLLELLRLVRPFLLGVVDVHPKMQAHVARIFEVWTFRARVVEEAIALNGFDLGIRSGHALLDADEADANPPHQTVMRAGRPYELPTVDVAGITHACRRNVCRLLVIRRARIAFGVTAHALLDANEEINLARNAIIEDRRLTALPQLPGFFLCPVPRAVVVALMDKLLVDFKLLVRLVGGEPFAVSAKVGRERLRLCRNEGGAWSHRDFHPSLFLSSFNRL